MSHITKAPLDPPFQVDETPQDVPSATRRQAGALVVGEFFHRYVFCFG